MKILVVDMVGRTQSILTVNLIAGFNNIPLTFDNLAAGAYLLRVMDEKNVSAITIRFVKE